MLCCLMISLVVAESDVSLQSKDDESKSSSKTGINFFKDSRFQIIAWEKKRSMPFLPQIT